MTHPLAGKPAPKDVLVDLDALQRSYRDDRPDPKIAEQRVSFGTSGHRGSALKRSFNEPHIVAIAKAVAEYRAAQGVDGPLLVGMDTHALSAPAQRTAVEVLAAAGVDVVIAEGDGEGGRGYTPTPVISHAILTANARGGRRTDGMVVTPSHNPPEDGGIKYDPPHGGPADTDATKWIEARANELLDAISTIPRMDYDAAKRAGKVRTTDFLGPYVDDLAGAIDLAAIRDAKLHLGVDPLGGSNLAIWAVLAERHGVVVDVANPTIDPTFSFMPLDHDGKIRMDCSSPYAMANLVALKDRYDLAFGNDADSDRHGIVTKDGLMSPNHFLAVAIDWLFTTRTAWRKDAKVGKTLVSSAMIDRVARALGRPLAEVPVGFKWFVAGLLDGSFGFGGEESAGASFLRFDGGVWTTDKDGVLLDLLAAEILAKTGKDPGARYRELEATHGAPAYTRIDTPVSSAQKKKLKTISPDDVRAPSLAGDAITARLTRSPWGNSDIGGLKVTTDQGWFAVRPSGTEDIYKLYAESFRGDDHLAKIVAEARDIVDRFFAT